ncbi:MAG: dockerin type I repeat-containing protein [Ruminococcus sp.]|nr:dockerin type I repeat-containing protein [Ruminococcus sp.]
MGDVNNDGEFNIADAVIFQKWLLDVPDTELKNPQCADINEDDILDVFDLCQMRNNISSVN